MGIKGSATCVLNFDDAIGYMIGPKNKGLNAMFTMMNLERIVVGIQGLGISEIAYQNSLSYAKERKQGKANNSKSSNGADFIIEHADIRKSLLNMKSIIEGERALCFWLSQQIEVSLNHQDQKVKQEASDFVSLMTPVVKTMFTDMGMEITSEAMQVHGGYGYTKDQGIEQLYRDNRITPIYEGTNSVQAADLVFRKLTNKGGDVINKYLDMIKNDYGRIVNIASVSGKDGNANASAYSSAKAGVIGLTKSLGKELAKYNIAVNAITPAGAKTKILDQMSKEHVEWMLSKVPRGRFLELDELSSMVCWLSSEDNSFSTAAVFDISGGRATY